GIKKLSMPVAFSIFQGIMPVLGYLTGNLFYDFLKMYSGIISFIILGTVGFNMIKEGLKDEKENTGNYSILLLILLSIATSIDAFAVGISFAAKGADIFKSSAIIAASTLILTLCGLKLSNYANKKLGKKGVIYGGIVLIAIGIKSLFG
ncbi:MAG: manganese efflux pump, partial [Clostridia bacterium]|nr:manganese efflux pump [Clostridia bacterium]